MASTAQFQLPLVLPSQAQKHVTVNEALTRLDALARLRVMATDLETPPAQAAEGAAYLIPANASGDWAGQDGQIAIRSNGGWVFAQPRAGWVAWDVTGFRTLTYTGAAWIAQAEVVSAGGAATCSEIVEFDHVLVPGATSITDVTIPAGAQVTGVTGRVVEAITGAGVSSWKLGVDGSVNRYGSGLGIGLNAYALGLTGAPLTYYADTPLVLTAEGGNFAGGVVRLAMHLKRIVPPQAI